MKNGKLPNTIIAFSIIFLVAFPLIIASGILPRSHLFTVDENVVSLTEDLENENNSNLLQSKYEEKGYQFSKTRSISVLKENESWELKSNEDNNPQTMVVNGVPVSNNRYVHVIENENGSLKFSMKNIWSKRILYGLTGLIIVLSAILVSSKED